MHAPTLTLLEPLAGVLNVSYDTGCTNLVIPMCGMSCSCAMQDVVVANAWRMHPLLCTSPHAFAET
jgi:hypothetical protein